MLQCTGCTDVPELDALVALTTMPGGPDNPPDVLALDDFALCELGEHDDRTEHAAQLWKAQLPTAPDLWLFWTGIGTHRAYRLAELPHCPVVVRRLPVGHVRGCTLFVQHPAAHSWDVTDPLDDLLTERAREEVRRLWGDEDDRADAGQGASFGSGSVGPSGHARRAASGCSRRRVTDRYGGSGETYDSAVDTSRDELCCGLCGQPSSAQHAQHAQHGEGSVAGAAKRVEYVVVELRGALAHYRAADDLSRAGKTVAAGLAENLGIDPADLPGCRYTCLETPVEYGVIRSGFELA
ncbi:hypothetical protein [Streptomyces sp. NPDC006510]|uniref:hypothetical protein n=1 Tax=Streptomyces sp. NPDC006510 TaxID=3155600 RepID=UPI0033A89A4E